MPTVSKEEGSLNSALDVSPRKNQKKSKKGFAAAVIIIIIIVIGGGFLINRFIGSGKASRGSAWQAVFLNNGQVYFGQVIKEDKYQVVLKDIYYLQVVGGGLQNAGTEGKQNELTLVKLGNELHGPKDEMRIVRENVLFIEELKDDSKVSTAIERYLAELEANQE